MLEFYHKFSFKYYTRHCLKLITDLETHLSFEKIPVSKDTNIILSQHLKASLDDEVWTKLNSLYNTLTTNKEIISDFLIKFIDKEIASKKLQDLQFLDFFSGCGGLGLGFKNLGFSARLINDIDLTSLSTYYFNNKIPLDHFFSDDIGDLSLKQNVLEKFAGIDLILGGPPCQGFSNANRQRLIDDPRNHLYKKFLLILKTVRPKFFLMENVRGMMQRANEIVNDFEKHLGSDYSINLILLNAKDFQIPQNRERVFVIGCKKSITNSVDIVSKIANLKKASPYFLKDALFGLPSLDPIRVRKSKRKNVPIPLEKYDLKKNNYLKYINSENEPYYLKNHENRFNNDRDILIYEKLPEGGNSLDKSISDIMPYKSRNHMFKDKYYKLKTNSYSKTITSHMDKDCNSYIHPFQPRGLSPRECARIQSFPDDFIFLGPSNKWYTQIGNAVPVKLAECFARVIRGYLN